MTTSFYITYTWRLRNKAMEFSAQDFVDAELIYITLQYFLSLYEGGFIMHIDGQSLEFHLSPDLSTVFDDVAVLLNKTSKRNGELCELYFYEQGTDLKMFFSSVDENTKINFELGLTSNPNVYYLSKVEFVVNTDVFISEWIGFIKSILKELIIIDPNLAQEQSYISYYNLINN